MLINNRERSLLKSILLAFYHLTRLPLPAVPFDEKSCGRSTAFFPAVGLILGLILAGLAWASQWCFPEQFRAALLVTGMLVLTGGIHLDGFMDSMDGLLSGRLRERKLEIMRDSRVGAFGVIGAICLLLTKYTLFLGLLGMPGQTLTRVLITVPALSRWSMVLAITTFPYARQEGLGKVYTDNAGRKELLIATLIAALVAGLSLNMLGAWLMLAGAAFTILAGRRITRALGGLTGDIYGFTNEMTEVVLLALIYPYLCLNAGI
ncbi:MAG: adenosylcobinamide-GDP ribazoletransferase [Peptococcaceae bacterium MAG4]|nr:adenosylcobinamide-GDP ribazoletransferase [Peptococcaceae bacterium MAG4]